MALEIFYLSNFILSRRPQFSEVRDPVKFAQIYRCIKDTTSGGKPTTSHDRLCLTPWMSKFYRSKAMIWCLMDNN